MLLVVHIMRNMSKKLQIEIDETTDVTNQEQVTVAMCRVDEHFDVYEEFLGLFPLMLLLIFLRFNLQL